MAVPVIPAARHSRAIEMQKYYLRLRKDHPAQGNTIRSKGSPTRHHPARVVSVVTGFAIYKPTQLSWLTALFGGFQAARYWHFWPCDLHGLSHSPRAAVFVVDPASLRAMITGCIAADSPAMIDRRALLRLAAGAGTASLVAACGWDGGTRFVRCCSTSAVSTTGWARRSSSRRTGSHPNILLPSAPLACRATSSRR